MFGHMKHVRFQDKYVRKKYIYIFRVISEKVKDDLTFFYI